MEKERKRWAIYYDETMLRNMEFLRKETAKKDLVPLKSVSPRRVVDDLLQEKYVEYRDKQNNRARITTIVDMMIDLKDSVSENTATTEALSNKIESMDLLINELAELIRKEKDELSI